MPNLTRAQRWIRDFLFVSGTLTSLVAIGGPGTVDHAFDLSGGTDGAVYALVPDASGGVLVGGNFSKVGGVRRESILRITPEGLLDPNFSPSIPDGTVNAIAIQPTDGMLVLGGEFDVVNGTEHANIARVLGTGANDTRFTIQADFGVYSIAPAGNGEVYIGGDFGYLYRGTSEYSRNYAARFQGNAVESWNTGGGDELDGPDSTVYALALQADGKVLIGGDFTSITDGDSEVERFGIARLRSSGGGNDATFSPGAGANGTVHAIALQGDGRILAGGSFTTFGNARHEGLVRLLSDGALDTNFGPQFGTNGTVYAIAFQADGKILVGGDFEYVNTHRTVGLARLNADGSVDTSFSTGDGFEDGAVYGILPQANGQILTGGDFSTVSGHDRGGIARINGDRAPTISSHPQSISIDEGAATSLVVVASNDATSYQWYKDGEPMSDSGAVQGARTSTLRFTAVAIEDEAEYAVAVISPIGSVLSRVAKLAVRLPTLPVIDVQSIQKEGDEFRFKLVGTMPPELTVETSADLRSWSPVPITKRDSGLISVTTNGLSQSFRVKVP